MTSTLRRRRLAEMLVRLRQEAGLTVEDVTRRLRWAKVRLTHMELNKWRLPKETNIVALLDLYGVQGEKREAVLELVRQSREKDWWASYRDVFPSAYPGFEQAAVDIRTFEALLVPGLLQTREYAEAIMRSERALTAQVIRRRVEARMARQKILVRENPPRLWAVIDEAALHRMVGGPEVMRAQLQHLIEAAARPNITVQVIPFGAGAHAAINGPFVILEFEDTADPPLVYCEGATKSLFMEEPSHVQAYNLVFERAVASALSPAETVGYLAELQVKYR